MPKGGIMELFYWMKKNHVSALKMSKDLDIHNSTLSNIVNNKTCPSLLLAMMIDHYTDGSIEWHTLLTSECKKRLDKFVKVK
jgi:plasmid maintenance system antidote protein VapI